MFLEGQNDQLGIYDGEIPSAPLIHRFHGSYDQQFPFSVTSTKPGEALPLTFWSDEGEKTRSG
ncbi:hypothetical protein [Xanthovirga aplysinae]|uniref:hypothetical protein n=1 Tax=Xanthovirga aplysinae TaxID=2529853 RepID=UPI0012BBAE21|nr:hypothetical protein [Xanthovirga aplysinae]MTI31639.1 hypothetical protein [Xanthovirga aplysinae]